MYISEYSEATGFDLSVVNLCLLVWWSLIAQNISAFKISYRNFSYSKQKLHKNFARTKKREQ